MKKLFKIVIIITIVLVTTGCSSSSNDDETDLSKDENTYIIPRNNDEQKTQETSNNNQQKIDYDGTVDDYLRNYERLKGSNVTIIGKWGSSEVLNFGAESKSLSLDIDQEKFDLVKIDPFAIVYVTGKSTINENGPIIEVTDLLYINQEKEPYWSSTEILNPVTSNMSSNIDYECLIYYKGSGIGTIIGSNVDIYMMLSNFEKGKIYRVLFNIDKYNSVQSAYEVKLIEYQELK